MENTGIIIEIKDGLIKDANYGMITCAAQKGENNLYALLMNQSPDFFINNNEQLKKIINNYKIKKIVNISIDYSNEKIDFSNKKDVDNINTTKNSNQDQKNCNIFNPIQWSDAIVQAIEKYEISTLFSLTNPISKEILPRIAANLEAPLIMDCLDVDKNYETARTSLYSGKTTADVKINGDIKIFAIKPNVIKPQLLSETVSDSNAANKADDEIIIDQFIAKNSLDENKNSPDEKNIELIESKKGELSGNDLVSADVIISGGRAMKNSSNFKLLYDCADAVADLGANSAVGASRVAVDLGWVPYRMQVGQTGEKVNPKVYIACGISGSIQHFAGMKMSGMIIAINENPEAAIMSNCDYFIKADLFEIIPALNMELLKCSS